MRYGTGVLLVLAGAFLWSMQGLQIRLIDQAGTWSVLFWRSAGMVPVLLAVTAWRHGGLWAPLRAVGRAGIMAGLGLVLAFGGAIFSLQSTSVAMAVFLFSAAPFLTAILARLLLGEAVRPATWGAIALAACGVALMVRAGLEAGAIAGNIAALISALGFALFTVALRSGQMGAPIGAPATDMMPAVALGGLFSMLAALAMLGVTGQSLLAPPRDLAIALGIGAVNLAGGMVLYTAGSRVLPAAELTLLGLVEVMLAPVWVWIFLGETAERDTLIGGALVLAAIALNAATGLARRRRRSRPATP